MYQYLFCMLIGYLFGTSNMALYISKIKNIDLRSGGSGNLGTSNAVIMMGKGAGIITLIHDVGKVLLAAFICRMHFPNCEYAAIVSAVACVLGHMYPFYLKFQGGKGFASFIGLGFVIDWRFGLFMLVGLVLVSLIFDWIVAGTIFHVVTTPIYLFATQRQIAALIVLIASACILLKHTDNIKRKLRGDEFGLRSVVFKKK